jgi:hypothetical protein
MVDFEQSRCFSTTAWRAALAGDNAVGPALCAALFALDIGEARIRADEPI